MKRILIPFCVLLCSCSGGPDLLVRSDRPLTLAEFQRGDQGKFPVPPSAHNIYFANYANWQEYEYIVRFDASPEDCERAIPEILAWHKPPPSDPEVNYKARSFGGTLPTSRSLNPVKWFDGQVIRRGLYAGEDASQAPNIWVDLDAGRLYYWTTD